MQIILSTSPNYNIFINKNLTLRNSKIAFLCRKLNNADHIKKAFIKDGTVHISSPDFKEEKYSRSTI